MRRILIYISLSLLVACPGFAKVGGGDIVFPAKKAGDALFSHDFHAAGAGLGCTACHDGLYVTKQKDRRVVMTEMAKGRSCGACHNGQAAFPVTAKGECNRCHTKK